MPHGHTTHTPVHIQHTHKESALFREPILTEISIAQQQYLISYTGFDQDMKMSVDGTYIKLIYPPPPPE